MSGQLVAIARVLLPAGLEPLEERFEVRVGGLDGSGERIAELAAGADALVADPAVPVDGDLLDACGPQLKVVANFAVGVDNIDLEACRERGVLVTNTPDVLTNATAELALALTLAAARRLADAAADLRADRWTGWDPSAYLGSELSGATVGIIGLGRIGRRYGKLLEGFEVELLYTARTPKPDAERELGAQRAELADLLRESDVISLHAPATAETHHLIDGAALEKIGPDAVLVNTARGSLVDLAALAAALRAGSVGAAGLDVFEGEPEVPRAILEAPRAVLTPHIGSATVRARTGMARTVAENVIAALENREPPNRVV